MSFVRHTAQADHPSSKQTWVRMQALRVPLFKAGRHLGSSAEFESSSRSEASRQIDDEVNGFRTAFPARCPGRVVGEGSAKVHARMPRNERR